jgi:hypothetical protein
MKLFWGLIETASPHRHTFDKDKWKLVSEFKSVRIYRDSLYNERSDGHVLLYTNTCLTCGDFLEKQLVQIPE